MKFLYALIALVILYSDLMHADGYGYLEKIENNHPTATLYILNTDPNPGEIYIADNAGNETYHSAGEIVPIPAGKSVTHFNNYIVPYQRFGGKIYIWLKDSNGNIINAAWIQEIDGYISFAEDSLVHKSNQIYIKDKMIASAFSTNCSRQNGKAPLICKWLRQDTNQQFTLQVEKDGTFILERYAETPVSKKCALGDVGCAFKAVGSFLTDTGNKIGDAFKDFGGNIKDGFNKLGSCMEVATLGTELAAKIAAKETVLSGNLTDGILLAAQETAVQPLIGARKAAEQILEAAKGFLAKIGEPVATGVIEGARQAGTGSLEAGEKASTLALTSADEIVKTALKGFDIQKIRYEGRLQELASGKLGNVKCTAIIVGQNINFDFDLNVKDPIDAIKNLANTIADKALDAAKNVANVLGIIRTQHVSLTHDDMIKLTMWHHTKKLVPLELALNTKD